MKTVTYDQVAETNSPLIGNLLIGEHALYRSSDNRVTYERVGTHNQAYATLALLTEGHVQQLSAATSPREAYEIWTTALAWNGNPSWHNVLVCVESPLAPMCYTMWEEDFRSGTLKMWRNMFKDMYDARPMASTKGITFEEYYHAMIIFRGYILSPDSVARKSGLANEAFGWNIPRQFHLLLFATLALTMLTVGTEVAED